MEQKLKSTDNFVDHCNTCENECKQRIDLEIHIKTKHCKDCKNKSNSKNDVVVHIVEKHEKEQ